LKIKTPLYKSRHVGIVRGDLKPGVKGLRTKSCIVTALGQQNTMDNEEEYLCTNNTSVTRRYNLILNASLLQHSNS